MDDDNGEKIRKFSEEDILHAKINRIYFGLEMRITVDHFLNHAGAQLISSQGRSIDVHPDTVKKYWELQSLICEYIKGFGTNPSIEEIKNKWATPARKTHHDNN